MDFEKRALEFRDHAPLAHPRAHRGRASCAAQGKQLTIEELLSAPFLNGLVAAPAGGAVAWTFNEAGSRNVCVARAPDYKGKRLTSYGGAS